MIIIYCRKCITTYPPDQQSRPNCEQLLQKLEELTIDKEILVVDPSYLHTQTNIHDYEFYVNILNLL